MGSTNPTASSCWVTLVTKPSYLPGAIILAHSLDKHGSKYPLIVQYTTSLGDEAIAALTAESQARGRIVPILVDLLLPRAGHANISSVAERFQDTFTKLRAFEVYKHGYTKACFLDADMAVFRDPDPIFDTELPGPDWLAANHACVCNMDGDKWASPDWNKGNCAYTTLSDPHQIFSNLTTDDRPTYQLINSGAFLFYPSEKLWNDILAEFNSSEKLKLYKFPDQDFLADFFRGKWQPISWRYNALKSMRYWHPKMWSDDEVAIVHYIVDKPWERQVSSDGIAGHKGRDGETHQWWWNTYETWLQGQQKGDNIVMDVMSKLVDTKEPFTKKIPFSQEPGKLSDVLPYPPY